MISTFNKFFFHKEYCPEIERKVNEGFDGNLRNAYTLHLALFPLQTYYIPFP